MRKLGLVLALAVFASTVVDVSHAYAERAQVEASPKGTIGLGLVGAELGFIVPAVAGLDATWAFVVFPVLGAGGGAAAGFFLLDDPGHVELSVAALATGLVLIIPSMVLTLSALTYDPEDEPAMVDETAGAAPTSRLRRPRAVAAAGGLLRWSDDTLGLGAPSLSVGRLGAATPLETPRGTEFRVSLFSATF